MKKYFFSKRVLLQFFPKRKQNYQNSPAPPYAISHHCIGISVRVNFWPIQTAIKIKEKENGTNRVLDPDQRFFIFEDRPLVFCKVHHVDHIILKAG